jgi:hypothetical protein
MYSNRGKVGIESLDIKGGLLLRRIQVVDDAVGLVAILIEESPGHLLLAAPGDADRPSHGITGNEYVVATPGARFPGCSSHHIPGLASLDLRLGTRGKRQAEAHTEVGENGSHDFVMVRAVDFGEGFDFECLFGRGPALATP